MQPQGQAPAAARVEHLGRAGRADSELGAAALSQQGMSG